MKPVRLRLRNFMQHEDTELRFNTGITGVIGDNGSGKSNLVTNGLFFALSGKSPFANKGDLLRWGADKGWTEFEFQHAGKACTLTRMVHSSKAVLTIEGEEEKRNADATEYMEHVFQRPLDVLYEECWVPQGQLTGVLDMTHSQRMNYFQKLTDTRDVEAIRAMLQAALVAMGDWPDRSDELKERRAELAADNEILHKLQTITIPAVMEILNEKATLDADMQAVLRLPTEAEYQAACVKAEAALCAEKQTRSQLNVGEPPVEVQPPTADMRMRRDNEKDLQKARRELARVLATKAPERTARPVSEAEQKTFETRLESLREQVAELRPKMQLASKKECPTCKRPYDFPGGEEARNAVIEKYTTLVGTSESLAELVSGVKLRVQEWEKAQASAQAVEDTIRKETDRLEKEVKLMTAAPRMSEEAYQKVETAHQEYLREYTAWEKASRDLREADARIVRAEEALKACKAAEFATDSQVASAKAHQDCMRTLQGKLAEHNEEDTRLRTRKGMLEEDIGRIVKHQEHRAQIFRVRTLFERAREKLHREQLPRIVMQKLLIGVNSLLSQYLTFFETSFTAHIDNNFDFLCDFAAQEKVPARLLSGGQKVALSIAFRFALSDIMASTVPLLVLDEPTVWLDDRNVRQVCQVLTRAREVAEKGVYVLVSTHEQALLSACNHIKKVGKE